MLNLHLWVHKKSKLFSNIYLVPKPNVQQLLDHYKSNATVSVLKPLLHEFALVKYRRMSSGTTTMSIPGLQWSLPCWAVAMSFYLPSLACSVELLCVIYHLLCAGYWWLSAIVLHQVCPFLLGHWRGSCHQGHIGTERYVTTLTPCSVHNPQEGNESLAARYATLFQYSHYLRASVQVDHSQYPSSIACICRYRLINTACQLSSMKALILF